MERRQRGMTLTELLTVCAVISILVSMMSPILVRAAKEATRRRCMANIEQIHVGLSLVANDNFGKLPKCYDTKKVKSNYQPKEASWWYRKVAKLMYPRGKYKNTTYDHLTVPYARNHSWWKKAANAGSTLQPFRPDQTILRCPSSRDFYDQKYTKRYTKASGVDKDRVFDDNYGYNNYGFKYKGKKYGAECAIYYKSGGEFFEHSRLYHTGNDKSHGGYKPMHPIRGSYVRKKLDGTSYIGDLADIPDPAGTVLLMDYVKADIAPLYDARGDIKVDWEQRHYPDGARFRHGGRANVLFADGHVEGFRDRVFRAQIAQGSPIHWTVKSRP